MLSFFKQNINAFRWIANICYVAATFVMISPVVASQAVTPWVLYLIGNAIWCIDVTLQRHKAWMVVSTYFVVWNIILICSRVFNFSMVTFVDPLLFILEKIP